MLDSTITFRSAASQDIDKVLNIEHACFDYDLVSKKSFDRFANNDNSDLILMERKGVPIGYGLVIYRKNSKKARLYSIAVKPEHKGFGYGKQLLHFLEKCAVSRKSESMILEVASKNIAAQKMYQNQNYRHYKIKKEYYTNSDDACCMTKKLLH